MVEEASCVGVGETLKLGVHVRVEDADVVVDGVKVVDIVEVELNVGIWVGVWVVLMLGVRVVLELTVPEGDDVSDRVWVTLPVAEVVDDGDCAWLADCVLLEVEEIDTLML